ncbi:MAG TPA: ATP-binding protein [Thiotrichaceae bacterium]|nr:ATP-binding protein [Thiotrichaceae bacterium]
MNYALQQIKLDNLVNFKTFKANLTNINLIVGDNDTGKTSLLKFLYAISKTWEIYSHQPARLSFKQVLSQKLLDTFQPRKLGIGDLVNHHTKEKLSIELIFANGADTQNLSFSFGKSTKNTIKHCTENVKPVKENYNTLFIPAKEVLTASQAIKFTREPHFLAGFDDTYLDLIKSLEMPAPLNTISEPFSEINDKIANLFEGSIKRVERENEAFIFQQGSQEIAMPLTAEGIKKIGILTTLINNRQLRSGSILFIDEPESALHPKAIRLLMDIIMKIASNGIQIVMSTHSYFVIKQLSINARKENRAISCFSLSKAGYDINHSVSDLREGLPSNPIVEEALKMFDQEIKLDLGL